MGRRRTALKAVDAVVLERRKRVAANLLGGVSYRAMAETLGVSVSTVHGDVHAILAEWREERVEKASDLVNVEMQRLDRMLNAIWNKVLDGDLWAIDRALRISERRSRLIGLDVPLTTRHLHDFSKMTVDELRQFIAQRFSQAGDGDDGSGAEAGKYLDAPQIIDGEAKDMA